MEHPPDPAGILKQLQELRDLCDPETVIQIHPLETGDLEFEPTLAKEFRRSPYDT